ncbi:3-oxoacyl-[acyl-carrier protein] reductase [Streptoalloteichus tenebrarius]|uniref:3-oxoacyl-[acyl-carrier protein] reductase n=1 Tax=Streptoalloteichus tenebrarius (strain ATCC 17920 / DSM 40477 / JCM 4838 / CBS 697.72 / NBRC 16177 / NCIMB 11028 / NRRL B-12390 / A12253. 1 / ISP 5477) TaxID=1933 RepID=A0ABT1HLV9_STRSD|nr:SDR family oxidoreductase [Streptoalloteichus tenebrarius]MCP2256488.1 3-oxoacyl-[acyl-carrier protein] reductase [Streptoalloteichus tenebrarius]BFF04840.1 SDR family oxidoreductase [Streptoalloteichus tenebrarius]
MSHESKVLAGRAAVVTGGSRGIGRAVVLRLAAEGASVVFSFREDEAGADRVVEEVRASGGVAWAVRADQADLAAVEGLFTEADRRFGAAGLPGLDVLVVNAGASLSRTIAETSEADYDRLMAVNAKGVFFTIQHALPRLRDGGRIVAVSSMSAVYATRGEAVYAASKAAVDQFVRVAAKEVGARGVTVNSVAPGPTDTDMLRGAVPDEVLGGVAQMTPLGRVGLPEDVAGVVAFLAGPDSGWITGQTIHANGGLV